MGGERMSELKLKTKELIELDKEIFKLNKFYSLAIASLNRFPNIYAAEEFSKKARLIRTKLKSIKTQNEFEDIFIENSLNNLESQETYLNYFSKGDLNVEEMVKVVLGENALNILKENIKNFDYKNFWKFYLSYQEYSYKSIPVDDENLRGRFKEILVNLKKDFLEYAKKEYALPENYDFEIVLGQPYSQRTFFHPTNLRMEIAPNSFFAFKDNNEIKINIALVIQNIFHEILGHGRQEVLSRDMPLSMQDNSINTSISSLHLHSEGISQLAEKDSIKFMRKFQKKYEIEEDYIQQRILGDLSISTHNFQAYYKCLGLKKIENNSFDKDKEFKKIAGNYGLSILYSSNIFSSLDFVGDAVYPLGLFYIKKYLEDLKEKIGEKKFNKYHVEINNAIVTGVFNFKTLPKWIELYLREKGVK